MRNLPIARAVTATLAAVGALALAAAPAAGQVRFSGQASDSTVRVMSWTDIPFRTVVRQEHDYSCGSAALATLLTYHYGVKTTERDAFTEMYADGDQAKIRKVGFSMLDMKRYLIAHGLQADGYRMSLDELVAAREPMIALISIGPYRHFVVIKGIRSDAVLIGDPALGLKIVPKAVFGAMWNGVVLALHEDATSRPPKFNLASEWSPWAAAPLRYAAMTDNIANLTGNLRPIYQITPVLDINFRPGS